MVEVWTTWEANTFKNKQFHVVAVAVQFPLQIFPSDYMQDGLFQVRNSAN